MVIIPNYGVKQVYKLEIWIGIISHHNSQLLSPVFFSMSLFLFLSILFSFLFFVLHFFFTLISMLQDLYFFYVVISMLQDLYFLYVVILMIQMFTQRLFSFFILFSSYFFHWCQCFKSNISFMLRFWWIKRSQHKNSFFVSPI